MMDIRFDVEEGFEIDAKGVDYIEGTSAMQRKIIAMDKDARKLWKSLERSWSVDLDTWLGWKGLAPSPKLDDGAPSLE